MELRDYLRILRKNWLIIVAATLLGLGAAAVFSLTRTPMYEASTTVFVSTQTSGSLQELQQGNSFSQARVTTYATLATQPRVLDPVISDLGLVGVSASSLAGGITATAKANTTFITITATNADPVLAASIANATGRSLSRTVAEIDMTNAQAESLVRLTTTQEATSPAKPASPNVPLNLALGGLIGLAVGIAIAVLRTVLDTRVRMARDLEALTDRPLIGAIPFDPKAKERPLILHDDPLNTRSEAFRALRTNLQFLEMDGGHTFVVTSSIPSEGKSTTTINLAIALADAGKRVALIDTDLRKPKVAEYLGGEGGAGLTDVLIGRARVADVMMPWGGKSMYVLPAGKIPPNPSELLGSPQMTQLLDAFAREFDVVLCDAPPLLPVTDAAVLSRSTSGAILVVAAGKASTNQVRGALDALATVGSKVAGLVMTMVPTRGPDAYGYGYGYGYGGYGVYGEPTPPKRQKPARGGRRRGGPIPDPVPSPQA